MPPEVRFSDLVQLLDFIYYGEIKLANDDLNSFMALAEHLQIRGLTDNEKQQQQQFQQQRQQKFPQKQVPKVPAAPQIVKRKGSAVQPPSGTTLASPGPSMGLKRRRTEPKYHQGMAAGDQQQMEYNNYEESEFSDQTFEDQHAVASTSTAAIQLTGLVCPHCRMVYHEVEALKNHIATAHRNQQQSNGKIPY